MVKNETGKTGKDKKFGRGKESGKARGTEPFDELLHNLKEDGFDDDLNEMFRPEMLEPGKYFKTLPEGSFERIEDYSTWNGFDQTQEYFEIGLPEVNMVSLEEIMIISLTLQ
ncbi:hypothetical protein AVEN_173100-1 [Araneus ventricosus]|uniref:Uncharacterized protein n=1 Tax=Araneus ventricosus TaxID=182803 RepID=A0A4Y2FJJ8_ARAVE|nr:hypothetical protein AVEN_173100-1 [Araneus ventricosus]